MDLHSMIIRWGIPTYFSTLNIDLTNTRSISLGKVLPEQIGRIYGLSIYIGAVDPDNVACITQNNSEVLYLNLKWGSSNFVNNIRLTDLVYTFTGLPQITNQRYLPVNIPKDFNLDQSAIINPTLIATGRVMLNMWYISDAAYNMLIQTQQVLINGVPGKNL